VTAALSVRGVGKRYGHLHALSDVTFDARAGELVAVIGPNGAGKTTLLSIIAGVLAPSDGEVLAPRPRQAGWAPQQAAVYSKLSVAENLELFARLERVPDPAAAVSRMLEQTGLQERAGERVERLSGGNRQRVNVALALMSEPQVLVLDEPSGALDPAQRERLWAFLGELGRRGTTVVFSTHNVAEAERYADRAILLASGRVHFDGAPPELLGAAGEPPGGDFERALVAYLRDRVAASELEG
jgi:ABC-2 type transport system ATP-binding protein